MFLLLGCAACAPVAAPDPAGLAGPVGEWLLTLLAACWLFLLPGWALLRLWDGAARLTLAEQAALATGVGLALYPLLLLLTDLIGLHLGPLYAWLPPLAALPLLLWAWRRQRAGATLTGWRAHERGGSAWPNLALLLVMTVIIVTRGVAVAGLEVPLWGDSLHHTMIAQLIIDQGGLFRSWEPYAAMQSFTYHFGFHSQVAALAWATGAQTPRAVVLSGQIANIAAVFALYPLALRLGRTRWAGVAALLIAGLLAPMPMYYVNWGRYTQLAGQAILPAGIYLAWELLAAPRRSWALLGLAGLTLAGMTLTHYRIAIFAAGFFPAFAIVAGVRLPWRTWAGRGALLAAGAGAILLPWFVRVIGGNLLMIMLSITAASAAAGGAASTDSIAAAGDLSSFLPMWAWYAVPLAIFYALWRREHGALLVALWWALVAVMVNPQWVRMPGSGTLTNFALLIAAYIPAALLIGAAGGWLLRQLRPRLALAAVTLAVAGLAWWGGDMRLRDVDLNATAMVTPADLRAAAWIEANTPADARFLINGFFPNTGAVVGSDAGWWLPLIAQRQTVLPPLLYISEQGPQPSYREWVNQLYAVIYAEGVASPGALALLRERGVGYVYLGQRQGSVGYGGAIHALTPEILSGSRAFRLVYHQDDVWVFVIEA
jgi:hypothetical protein